MQAPSQPPAAAISATPGSGHAPLTVSFNASGSHDPNSGGAITQYSFNFGDGTAPVVQSAATVSHTYTVAANHIASVTVTDSEGGSASASRQNKNHRQLRAAAPAPKRESDTHANVDLPKRVRR